MSSLVIPIRTDNQLAVGLNRYEMRLGLMDIAASSRLAEAASYMRDLTPSEEIVGRSFCAGGMGGA